MIYGDPAPVTDLALLRQWTKMHDAKAFNEITSRYAAMVHATCLRILRNITDAEDVAQECFEALVRTSSPPKDHLGAWLHTVATNRSLTLLRAKKRRKTREADFASGRETSAEMQWNDIYEYVDEAITMLPEKLRALVAAHYIERQSLAALARVEGVSPRTIRYRIDKGVKQVARSLRKRGVATSASALPALLGANLAEAAPLPASLASALEKLALAQVGAATPGNAFLAITNFKAIGALILMKKTAVGVALLVALAFGYQLLQENSKSSEPPIQSQAQNTRADATPPAPTPAPERAKEVEDVVAQATIAQEQEASPSSDAPTVEYDPLAVSGIVLNEAGKPVADAKVIISDYGFAKPIFTTMSMLDGSFQFDDFSFEKVAARTYYGQQRDKVFATRAEQGAMISKPHIEQEGRGPFSGIELTLSPAATVSGKVIDPSGAPVSGINIAAYLASGFLMKSYERDASGISDAQGRFDLRPLRPGIHKLILRRAYRIYNMGKIAEEEGTEIEVAAGEHFAELVLVYDRFFTISGQATLANGGPIENLNIHARGEWGTSGGAQAITDAKGRYEISDLAEGVYTVSISNRDYEYEYAELRRIAANSRDVNFTITASPTISGQVLAADTGEPLEVFRLATLFDKRQSVDDFLAGEMSGGGWQYAFKRHKDPEGRFSIKSSKSGRTYIIAKANGYSMAAEEIDFSQSNHIDGVVITLEPTGRLEGVVKNDKGAPIKDAAVFLGRVSQDLIDKPAKVLTDADGMFAMPYAPGVIQSISAYHPDYALGSIEVGGSNENTDQIEIILSTGGGVQGFVQLSRSEGFNVAVTIQYPQSHYLSRHETLLDSNGGAYQLINLAPGNAVLRFGLMRENPPYGRTIAVPIRIENGKVTVVDFELPETRSAIEGIVTSTDDQRKISLWGFFTGATGQEEEHFTVVLPDGSYRMDQVPEGIGTLRLEAENAGGGPIELSVSVEVREGETFIQDFDLAP